MISKTSRFIIAAFFPFISMNLFLLLLKTDATAISIGKLECLDKPTLPLSLPLPLRLKSEQREIILAVELIADANMLGFVDKDTRIKTALNTQADINKKGEKIGRNRLKLDIDESTGVSTRFFVSFTPSNDEDPYPWARCVECSDKNPKNNFLSASTHEIHSKISPKKTTPYIRESPTFLGTLVAIVFGFIFARMKNPKSKKVGIVEKPRIFIHR